MASTEDTNKWVSQWFKDYQPDPYPQVGDIYSGLRAPVGTRAKDVTSPCQYWIKGMPGICKNFQDDKCNVKPDENDKYPTGYNNGKCDYLGRRNWCDQYDNGGTEDLKKYICIAPDMFRTGLGKRDISVTTHLVLLPYPKSEILGYNEDEGTGVGQCDGLGMGRGKAGKDKKTTDPEKMYKLPVVCRHYKPWIMGFGAIKPHPMGTAVLEGKDIYDGTESDPLSALTRYLPFAFCMYNMRALYQKCAYWDQDFGTDFEMDYSGGYASIELSEDPLTECTCTDEASTPYKTIIDEWLPNTSDTLMNVLSPENGIVCNGAKPECPCYTGKWIYCVDDNMRDGMRITAEQIMELRFWTAVWQSKKVYDSIFAEKSGTSDTTTSDIFTFDKWEKLGNEVGDSVMKGKRIYQCFPIPLNKREFDSKVYLTKKAITYPKANAKTGTSDSKKSSFPTLIRQIDAQKFVPYLNVLYPYSCKDPWGVVPCKNDSSKSGCMEIASCNLESPATAIFGYTIRNRNIYALNINKINSGKFLNKFKTTKIALLPKKERGIINKTIKNLIESSSENGEECKYTASGVSDQYGYFGIGPLKLEYNTTTAIAVICEHSSEEYEVTIIEVSTKFYGGCIVQDGFEYKYEATKGGYVFTLPVAFGPEAKLQGHVNVFGGNVGSIFPVYNKYKYGITHDTVFYSYCIHEYTVENKKFKKWVMIGPTCYIWVEIDNVDISYMFDFEIVEAYMTPQANAQVCGGSESNIVLEVVFPKTNDTDAIKRKHILPNGVLLKSQKPFAFFNEDWDLFIKYKYRMLKDSKDVSDSTTEEIVWPSGLDEEGSLNRFVSPPFSLEVTESAFEVNGFHFGTIAIMVYIVDDVGRIQSAVATKMLCDIVTTRCRPVEISYSYAADAIGYDLIPNSGFFTWVGADKVLPGDYRHPMRAKCGDHDCNPDNCIGPMWYPFNNCTSIDFYSWYSGAATCTLPIEGQPRSDWRYCMADEYKAWVRQGGNWAAACGNGWYYSYSKTVGENEFTGFSKIRTSVYLLDYRFKGWTSPPFGNDGREITERWLSQEHCCFWDLSGIKPTPKSEYMPLVFDDEMLFTSFNAFDEHGRIGPMADCLHTTCMLNYMLSDAIAEHITDERYRFEDLFNVITHGMCMYPPPLYAGSVTRYGFKVEDVAWAWREYWKDIERNINGEGLLNFVNITRPDYYFDVEKTEHRLITDEGEKIISFIAPEKNEEGTYTYPEISIGGAYPRRFILIYEDYSSEQVDWMDEGGDGTENGSGGAEEQSIYEVTTGNEWYHDPNTIFDYGASTDKSDDRRIVVYKDPISGDTYTWYNRGLIANIPKNRLNYLPYKEEIMDSGVNIDIAPNSVEDGYAVWEGVSVFSDDVTFSYSGGGCVTRILIEGCIGASADKNTIYCKPGVVVSECGLHDEEGCSSDPPTILYSSVQEKGNKTIIEEKFNMTIKLSRLPDRMLYSSPMLKIKFTFSSDQTLKLLSSSPIIYVGKYVDAVESIKVWEQRYITSTGEFGDKNPEGVNSKEVRSFDRSLKNAGQYFPTGINTSEQDEVRMRDKMTMVGAGEQFQEDENLDVSISNLKTIEVEEQRKLYEDAYNRDDYDTMTYSVITHPGVQHFFSEYKLMLNSLIGTCKFESEKLPFDKTIEASSFDQSGDFWQPGGHYFRWGDNYRKEKCWLIGPIETIYSPKVVHHNHGGSGYIYSPYEAYVGWGKLEYYEGTLTQAILLQKGIDTGYAWAGAAGGFVMETFT